MRPLWIVSIAARLNPIGQTACHLTTGSTRWTTAWRARDHAFHLPAEVEPGLKTWLLSAMQQRTRGKDTLATYRQRFSNRGILDGFLIAHHRARGCY